MFGQYDGEVVRRTDNIFSRLDAGMTVGTSGLGFNLATNVTDYVNVRAGIEFMPQFNVPLSFDITSYSADGVVSDAKFPQIQEIMQSISGIEVGRTIHMKASPRSCDVKLLVDIYPWREDKRWHFTVGFYYGKSEVAHVENDAAAMTQLLAVKIYNHMYDFIMSGAYWEVPLYQDYYLSPDEAQELKEKMEKVGRVGVHLGTNKATGKPFMLEPGTDGMLKANLKVNRFKPYVGFGYNTPVGVNGRLKIGFDAGVLMCGAPKLITNKQPIIGPNGIAEMDINADEGTMTIFDRTYDLINDVSGIHGKVGTYIDIAKAFRAYPVVNFKISYTIF